MSNDFDLEPLPEVSEKRRPKYNELSKFLNFVECSKMFDDPQPSHHELINRYLDQEEQYDKIYEELTAYEADCYRHNERLLKVIKKVKGKTFYKYILEILKESNRVDGKMEIVRKPCGEFQKEKYGRTIDGIWVDQWSVGTEGDSFEGYVCVLLKPNKYLKFSYSM